eukprot:GHVS01033161.1.p2 GENE.GHVS01033161.1~~GHVS01033161.1.p2  ORF type:complete len:120 (+),score=20.12 GHVS01033161.1:884-1243(+)
MLKFLQKRDFSYCSRWYPLVFSFKSYLLQCVHITITVLCFINNTVCSLSYLFEFVVLFHLTWRDFTNSSCRREAGRTGKKIKADNTGRRSYCCRLSSNNNNDAYNNGRGCCSGGVVEVC